MIQLANKLKYYITQKCLERHSRNSQLLLNFNGTCIIFTIFVLLSLLQFFAKLYLLTAQQSLKYTYINFLSYTQCIKSICNCSCMCTYVTGFGKTCIVHTSNFAQLESHKALGNHNYIDLKLSGIMKEQWFYIP